MNTFYKYKNFKAIKKDIFERCPFSLKKAISYFLIPSSLIIARYLSISLFFM